MSPSSLRSCLIRLGALLVVSVGTLASATSARAQLEPPPSAAEGRCETPRQALFTVLYWLQPERLDRTRAAACLDRTDMSEPEREAPPLAAAIKLLLDREDIWVDWADISDDPNYKNAGDNHRLAIYPDRLLGIEVVKINGRWLVSRGTLQIVSKLVEVPEEPATGIAALLPDWLRADVFGIEAWQLIVIVCPDVDVLVKRDDRHIHIPIVSCRVLEFVQQILSSGFQRGHLAG
jgi:hypothetical protein